MNLQSALETDFWKNHKIGDQYTLKNRNGSEEVVKIAYYPLEDYLDFKALIEMPKYDPEQFKHYNDFREVPIRFLTRISPPTE